MVGIGIAGLSGSTVEAAGARMYLSPSSPTIALGQTVTVALRITPAEATNGVGASICYPSSGLVFESVSANGSAFPVQLVQAASDSCVQIERGILGGTVSTDALIATLTFTTARAGAHTVSVNNPSATADGGYVTVSSAGATISITASSNPSTTSPPASSSPSSATAGGA